MIYQTGTKLAHGYEEAIEEIQYHFYSILRIAPWVLSQEPVPPKIAQALVTLFAQLQEAIREILKRHGINSLTPEELEGKGGRE